MKSLRKSTRRIDRLRTEARPRKRGLVSRYIYLALLGGLALYLFDLLAGDLVYLRGDGMVTQDVVIVAPEYVGTVRSVSVAPGDSVVMGQKLGRLRSQKMVMDIAQLTAQVADTEIKLSELRIERQKLAGLLPAARRRAASTDDHLGNLRRLERSGLATGKQIASAVVSSYSALESLRDLEARAELVRAEYEKARKSVVLARHAMNELTSLYDGGLLSSSLPGLVGTVLISPGKGVKQGEPLVEIFHGPRYVLAYVPVGTLYDVDAGDEIVMRFGFKTIPGRVEARLPLAYRLPREFQRQFRTAERKQLVRVRVLGDIVPPLFTEVEVTWRNSPRAVFANWAIAAKALIGSARHYLERHAI